MDPKKLNSLWKESGFRPCKRFGQNFLIDENVRDNILRSAQISRTDTVVEIGPGFGMMSFELGAMCRKLYAVEKDKKICAIMEPFFRAAENITLIPGDILEEDLCAFSDDREKITVFGNIPYNITTPIIQKIIEAREYVKKAVLLVQNEFAIRLSALPGSKDYSSISCYVQYYTKVTRSLKIGKKVFSPNPGVDSCLIRMDILSEPSVKVKDEILMFRIIRRAFSQRRKKALNPLSRDDTFKIKREEWINIFEKCGLDPGLRAEDISLADYARLSDVVGAR